MSWCRNIDNSMELGQEPPGATAVINEADLEAMEQAEGRQMRVRDLLVRMFIRSTLAIYLNVSINQIPRDRDGLWGDLHDFTETDIDREEEIFEELVEETMLSIMGEAARIPRDTPHAIAVATLTTMRTRNRMTVSFLEGIARASMVRMGFQARRRAYPRDAVRESVTTLFELLAELVWENDL